ncbi:U3 small nucleolar ribonucleoprotein IMP4-like [Clarias gariepinus]
MVLITNVRGSLGKSLMLMFERHKVSARLNGGNHEVDTFVYACKAMTDLVIVQPDRSIVSHLPFGPTDIPDIGTMSEAFPHLIFDNLTSLLSRLARHVLYQDMVYHLINKPKHHQCSPELMVIIPPHTGPISYLFPVPKEDSKRVITFGNQDGFIAFGWVENLRDLFRKHNNNSSQLRREARLRKEYLYRKAQEDRWRFIEEKKKRKLKPALESVSTHVDDEYKWAGVEDPKVMVTTSRDPSPRLKMFAKEVKLIFPGAQRMNRGNHKVDTLVHACKAKNVTDLVIVHETRGQPDGLIVSHWPSGPTAYFTLYNVVMRHDIPDIGTMPEAFPHLIFNNFTSRLGRRVSNILKYLFPVPKEDSKRVITFANQDDFIAFRHHVYKKTDHEDVELTEVGPRFHMKLYMIKLGTLENESTADVEWHHHDTCTAKKRKVLSVN